MLPAGILELAAFTGFEKRAKNYEAAAQIAKQMIGESDAIKNYEALLSLGILNKSQEDRIREFISDEKNHTEGLLEIQEELDKIKPMED